jgi:hypothetical protein
VLTPGEPTEVVACNYPTPSESSRRQPACNYPGPTESPQARLPPTIGEITARGRIRWAVRQLVPSLADAHRCVEAGFCEDDSHYCAPVRDTALRLFKLTAATHPQTRR